jgi:hypothetical protein
LWWSVVPFVKSTRAPGMALFVVSFVAATFAAFGVDRLQRREGKGHVTAWWVAAGLVGLFALAGVIGAVAGTLAPVARTSVVSQAAGAIRVGALLSAVGLLAIAALAWSWMRERVPAAVLAFGLIAVVGADLWWNAQTFWNYSRAPEEVYGSDPIKEYLQAQTPPIRVWDVLYPGASLMAAGVPQWFGHHGNELHAFDVLHGRDGINLSFRNEGHPALLDLYAINYITTPAGAVPDSLPGYRRALSSVETSSGAAGDLFERREPAPYVRFVPGAVAAPLADAAQAVLDPRFPRDRVVILDPEQAGNRPLVTDTVPDASGAVVRIDAWEPGAMRMAIEGGAPSAGYLVVSENYYQDWQAEVDGVAVETLRGNGAMLTVAVEPGAREVVLRYESAEYETGKLLSLSTLGLALVGMVVPPVMRRRRRDG